MMNFIPDPYWDRAGLEAAPEAARAFPEIAAHLDAIERELSAIRQESHQPGTYGISASFDGALRAMLTAVAQARIMLAGKWTPEG